VTITKNSPPKIWTSDKQKKTSWVVHRGVPVSDTVGAQNTTMYLVLPSSSELGRKKWWPCTIFNRYKSMTNQYQRGTNAPSRKVVTYLFSMVGNAYTYNVYELIFSFVVWLSGLGAMFHYHRTRKLETLLLAWRSPLSIPLAHTIASLLARAFPSPATPSPHQRMPRRRNDNGKVVGTHNNLGSMVYLVPWWWALVVLPCRWWGH
jgi:hypothetical protein